MSADFIESFFSKQPHEMWSLFFLHALTKDVHIEQWALPQYLATRQCIFDVKNVCEQNEKVRQLWTSWINPLTHIYIEHLATN